MARAVAVEGHRLIKAPPQRVWHLLSRLESHPRYVTLWMAADVHERSPTTALVEFRGFFGGLPISSVQRITLRPPSRIEFRQVRGELRELSGAYILKEVDGETVVTIQVSVDADILLFPDASVQQIVVGHIDGTLGRIKASAERDLVRLTPRRVRAPRAGALATAPAEGEAAAEAIEAFGPDVPAPHDQPLAAGHPPASGYPGRAGQDRRLAAGAASRESPGGPPAGPAAGQRPPGAGRRGRRRRRRRGRGGGRVPFSAGGERARP